MVNALLTSLLEQLERLPSVLAVSLFGSHAREAADPESDIDLQIITSEPRRFFSAGWLAPFPYSIEAYGRRPAFGGVTKITIVFAAVGEADLVILPAARLRLARLLMRLGVQHRSTRVRRGLADLALVLRPGFRVLKGARDWEPFLRQVVAEVPDARLDDEAIARKADCAYADFISLQRKLRRGELVAAQRWLHVHLVETNLALAHELRTRQGRTSFHDGRRLEQIMNPAEVAKLSCDAGLKARDIDRAARSALRTTHQLASQLTGHAPDWRPPGD